MNIKPSTIFTGDNLPIMRGMEDECVDLIYLDPPFNSKHDYAAPIGSKAAGTGFRDTWTLSDIDEEWHEEIERSNPALYQVILAAGLAGGDSDKAYLIYMAVRLLEMRRILKSTGAIYFHCDKNMSHSVKLMLDAIFGGKNFYNEIVWCYRTGGASKRKWAAKHDAIMMYTKEPGRYQHNALKVRSYVNMPAEQIERSYIKKATDSGCENGIKWWEYMSGKDLMRIYNDPKDDGYFTLVNCRDWWDDIKAVGRYSAERTGYRTQKPLELLKRIIAASSNEGDWVLDPFCGCATTCLAAHILNRNWIGIDFGPKSYDLIRSRLETVLGTATVKVIKRTDIPSRKVKRTKGIRKTLYGKQSGNCSGCGEHFELRNFHLDHIVARDKGGMDNDENLQLLCGSCNSIKGPRSMEYLRAQLKKHGYGKYRKK